MKAVPTCLTSEVDRHCRTINALITKLEHAERKVDEYQRAIGQHIAAIKEMRPGDWQQVIEAECKIKKSRAYELLRIGDGTKTVEETRAKTTERSRRHRAIPLRNGKKTSTTLVKVEPSTTNPAIDDQVWDSGPPGPSNEHPADARRRGFMWRASEAVRFARFDDLAGLKVDEEMRKAVKDAADAWAELQVALAEREASTASAEVVETTRDESEPDDCDGELVT